MHLRVTLVAFAMLCTCSPPVIAPARQHRRTRRRQQHRLDALTAKAAERQNADGTFGLGEGDKGRAVKNVQLRLEKAGFDPSRTDGVMDERTSGALKAFQRKAGLEPTGRTPTASRGRASRTTSRACRWTSVVSAGSERARTTGSARTPAGSAS
jgi:peptidoglycan hydrolase-like protein with peptidoglycan-binding domain